MYTGCRFTDEKACCRPKKRNSRKNFRNYYKQWLYECKEEEYTVHVWADFASSRTAAFSERKVPYHAVTGVDLAWTDNYLKIYESGSLE